MLIYLEMIGSREGRSKFERVYQQYRGLMLYVAGQILDNREDAEDAVIEAFVSIAHNIDKISDPECTKTRAYAVIITENKAKDLLRAKNRRPAVELDEETEPSAEPPEDSGQLARAIMRLPPMYQRAILLKYDDKLTNAEVGEMLGLSYEGVHSLLRRAKEKLRKLLEDEGMTV